MLKPFNLEEAKAGKPFGLRCDPKDGVKRFFIGKGVGGTIFYDKYRGDGGHIGWDHSKPDGLFMLPTTKKLKIRLLRNKASGHVWPVSRDADVEWAPLHEGLEVVKEFEVEYEE